MHSCGMGVHADLVPMDDIVMMAKWLVVAEILYAFNLGWTKLSLLLMYYRIFHFPYFKRMAWAVGAFVMAWVVCVTFLFIFICVPVEKLWYPELPGRCINQVGTWIANAAATILTDIIILLMPIPQIWGLQLGTREKIGLTTAFFLGFLYAYLYLRVIPRSANTPTASSSPLPTEPACSSLTTAWTLHTLSLRLSAGLQLKCPRVSPRLVFRPCSPCSTRSLVGSASKHRCRPGA